MPMWTVLMHGKEGRNLGRRFLNQDNEEAQALFSFSKSVFPHGKRLAI